MEFSFHSSVTCSLPQMIFLPRTGKSLKNETNVFGNFLWGSCIVYDPATQSQQICPSQPLTSWRSKALREKCPNTESISVFSRIKENTGQKKLLLWKLLTQWSLICNRIITKCFLFDEKSFLPLCSALPFFSALWFWVSLINFFIYRQILSRELICCGNLKTRYRFFYICSHFCLLLLILIKISFSVAIQTLLHFCLMPMKSQCSKNVWSFSW